MRITITFDQAVALKDACLLATANYRLEAAEHLLRTQELYCYSNYRGEPEDENFTRDIDRLQKKAKLYDRMADRQIELAQMLADKINNWETREKT